MTNVMKKLSALLLTLALLFTMMPALSIGAYAAEGDVLSVTVNGTEVGTITSAWIEENMEEPQIFPFVSSKGNKFGYMIAEGPSYEALLMEALGVDDLSVYAEGELVWTATDGVQDGPNNILKVEYLLGAKEQIGFQDQNDEFITGGFGDKYTEITTATAVKIPGTDSVTPILGTAQSKGTYATYEEAVAALEDGSWKTDATSEVRAYIGGNTGVKAVVKENGGAVDMSSPNITGKFSIANVVSLDLRGDFEIPEPDPVKVLDVTVDGEPVGTITDKWIKDNMEEPQIFPFVSSKGNKFGYMIAEGPSYEALLMEALGADDLSEYADRELVWTATDGVQDGPNNILKVEYLLGAKEQIGFEDQDGNTVTEGFGDKYPEKTTVTAVKIPGTDSVTPILGTAQSKGTYATYEEAEAALADGSWKTEATSEMRAYIGGNTGVKAVVKENGGAVDMSSPNITGKFSIGSVISLDVRTPEPAPDPDPVKVLDVTVDGEPVGTITDKWIKDNMEEPQIFPFVSSKGNKFGYMIAEGPSYEALLMEALGVDDLSEYADRELVWTATDGVQDGPNNILKVEYLLGAKEQIAFKDQDDNIITEGFGDKYPEKTTVTAVKIDGTDSVTPIFGTAQSKGTYATYDEAVAALADGSWRTEATSEMRAYIGGNTGVKAVVKENGGAVDMSSPNITGKFSIGSVISLDVRTPKPEPEPEPVDVLTVNLNGKAVGTITDKWIKDNMENPQIFPFVSSKGNKFGYMIAEGPSYEALLMEALGVDDLSKYSEGELVWTATDGVQDGPNNILKVEYLLGAKEQIAFKDQDDNIITEGFGDKYPERKTVTAVKISGTDSVTPIFGTAQSKGTYATYEEAEAALADGSWRTEATSEMRAYIGGNTGVKAVVKENGGAVDMSSPNITGKFSIGSVVSLDLRLVPAKTKSTMTFTKTTAQTASVKCSDAIIDLFGGVTWKSSNTKIAKVDKNGKVTPTGIGKCTVTATLGSGDVVTEVAVTVKEAAFKPATPKSPKVTNVKTKAAKLTWKKVSTATGYEIKYGLKKSFKGAKTKTIGKNSTVKATIKKLKKGKTYYFKIRAYKTVNGKKVYSSYTKTLKVKIKK